MEVGPILWEKVLLYLPLVFYINDISLFAKGIERILVGVGNFEGLNELLYEALAVGRAGIGYVGSVHRVCSGDKGVFHGTQKCAAFVGNAT